ncbi:MAG: DUF2459 domain-containing protein [Stellaceae bacterium]
MLGQWSKILAAVVFLGLPVDSSPSALGAPREEVVYVVAGGWHTEIAVRETAVIGPLAGLAAGISKARYLVFGWGARDFYMARNPGFGDLLRAAFPGPAVMLVIPLMVQPQAYFGVSNVWPIAITRAGAVHLAWFLWESIAKDARGTPIRAGDGPYPQGIFYAATGIYDASNTCNTWTANALRTAGLPVTAAGVVFASQVLKQLPR